MGTCTQVKAQESKHRPKGKILNKLHVGEAKLLNEEYALGFRSKKCKKFIADITADMSIQNFIQLAVQHKLNLQCFMDYDKPGNFIFGKFVEDGIIKRREMLTMIIMLTKGSLKKKSQFLADLYAEDDYVSLKNFEELYETCAEVALEIITQINTIETTHDVASSIKTYLKNIRRFRANGIGALKKNLFLYETKIPVYLFKACFEKKFSVLQAEIKKEQGASLSSLTSCHQFRLFLADLRVQRKKITKRASWESAFAGAFSGAFTPLSASISLSPTLKRSNTTSSPGIERSDSSPLLSLAKIKMEKLVDEDFKNMVKVHKQVPESPQTKSRDARIKIQAEFRGATTSPSGPNLGGLGPSFGDLEHRHIHRGYAPLDIVKIQEAAQQWAVEKQEQEAAVKQQQETSNRNLQRSNTTFSGMAGASSMVLNLHTISEEPESNEPGNMAWKDFKRADSMELKENEQEQSAISQNHDSEEPESIKEEKAEINNEDSKVQEDEEEPESPKTPELGSRPNKVPQNPSRYEATVKEKPTD